MKKFIICISFPALLSCNNGEQTHSDIQSFPDYKISLSCPCTLTRDSIKENKIKADIGNEVICFTCTDTNNSDKYYVDILMHQSSYTPDEILSAIDSTLSARQIEHKRKTISGNEAMIISYKEAKELELFSNEFSYYLVLEASDSLDRKFDSWINSIILEK